MMKQNKSKSNILANQRKEIKVGNFHSKNKLKHSQYQKQPIKHVYQIKYSQHEKKHLDVLIKHNFQKSKPLKFKGNDQKHSGNTMGPTQKRKSQSIVSTHRPSSRLSNKRGSVLSTKSNKQIKNDILNENNKNAGNLEQTKQEKSKKSTKNQSKNKLSMNENIQEIQTKVIKKKKNPSKQVKKNKQISQIEKKLSNFLNQKDLFSSQFLANKKQSHKNIQKSKSRPSSRQNSCHKLIEEKINKQRKQSKQRQNLLQIYQFYKKTFDINLNNCLKKGATMTISDKTRKTSSNCSMRPSYSSTLIQKFDKKSNEIMKLNNFQSKQMHSNLSSSKDKKINFETSKRQLIQLKEDTLFEKQTQLKSISKSRHSLGNSESSTKDNVVYANGSRQIVQVDNSQRMTKNKRKKSFKQLIIYSSNIIEKLNKQNEQTNNFSANLNKESMELIDMKNIEIGSSSIDVLKWCWNNTKEKQFRNQNQNKSMEGQLQPNKQKYSKSIESEIPRVINDDNPKLDSKISETKIDNMIEQKMIIHKRAQGQEIENMQINKFVPKKLQKMIDIEEKCSKSPKTNSSQINAHLKTNCKDYQFPKIKQKEEEASSIQQLSSIELMVDGKNVQENNIPSKRFNFQVQDSGFEL